MLKEYSDSHRGSPMACFLDERIMCDSSGWDEFASHPVLSEGVALIGRRVFFWDDYGFVHTERYPTVALATHVWEEIARGYSDEDEEMEA